MDARRLSDGRGVTGLWRGCYYIGGMGRSGGVESVVANSTRTSNRCAGEVQARAVRVDTPMGSSKQPQRTERSVTVTNEPKFIPVTTATIGKIEVQAVEARDLHAGLGVKRDFTNWVKQQIERLRLVSDRDFRLDTPAEGGVYANIGENSPGVGRPAASYWFTLDTAKHIAMMTNTERGFAIREYFIDCERRAMGPIPSKVISQKPWLERSLEERNSALKTANTLGRIGNHATAWWYLVEIVQVAKFPKHLLPAWHQSALDLQEHARTMSPYTPEPNEPEKLH